MADIQLSALTWESFLQVVPATTPRSQLPFLYSVHVECLSRYGKLDFVDAKALNIPSHKFVTPFAHSQAARPGYCYLLMYKDSIILQMAKYLGEYPTLRRVLDVPTKRFNLGVIPHLYVTLTSSGALHIDVEGTWKLEDVLKYLVDTGMPRGGFRTLSKSPVETPITDQMVVGMNRASSLQPDLIVLKVAHPAIRNLDVGDRCFLVGKRCEVQGVLEVTEIVAEGLKMRHVSSVSTDVRLPTVRCGQYSFQFVEAECVRCGRLGRVDAHCAICDNLVELSRPLIDYERGYHAFCEDISRHYSRTRDFSIYDNSNSALVDTLLYFVAAKYPAFFPDKWNDFNLFGIACINYHGIFRDVFCDVLRAWSQTPGLDSALHSTILPWTDYMGVEPGNRAANLDTILKTLVVGREDLVVPYVRVNTSCYGGFYLSSVDAVNTSRVAPVGLNNVHYYNEELVRAMIMHRCNFGSGMINDVLREYIMSMFGSTHFVSCKFIFNLLRCYICNQVLSAEVGEPLSVTYPVSGELRDKANWMWFTDNFALVTSLSYVPIYEDD